MPTTYNQPTILKLRYTHIHWDYWRQQWASMQYFPPETRGVLTCNSEILRSWSDAADFIITCMNMLQRGGDLEEPECNEAPLSNGMRVQFLSGMLTRSCCIVLFLDYFFRLQTFWVDFLPPYFLQQRDVMQMLAAPGRGGFGMWKLLSFCHTSGLGCFVTIGLDTNSNGCCYWIDPSSLWCCCWRFYCTPCEQCCMWVGVQARNDDFIFTGSIIRWLLNLSHFCDVSLLRTFQGQFPLTTPPIC